MCELLQSYSVQSSIIIGTRLQVDKLKSNWLPIKVPVVSNIYSVSSYLPAVNSVDDISHSTLELLVRGLVFL